MPYNWQQKDWPHFRYDLAEVEAWLLAFADHAGQIEGLLRGLPEESRWETVIDVMLAEAVKTSEIEGEYVSRPDVRSSLRNRLGLNTKPENVKDQAAAGVGELMVAVRETWDVKLDEKTLFAWHRMLMKGQKNVLVGAWRRHEEPMQVISGSFGRQKVHFEGPPSGRVPKEMREFVRWFNESRKTIPHAPVRAALAHLYFESIHPFEDGNGRIGRALSEKALSQGLRRPAVLSLSRTIEAGKRAYYIALETAQRSNEVTPWIHYFIRLALDSQIAVEKQIDFVLRQARLWDDYRGQLNARQERVLQRMFEAGPEGFEGGINARKYVSMTKASKATATRDLQELVELGVLTPLGGGRSTRYELKV